MNLERGMEMSEIIWENKDLIDVSILIKDGTHGTHKDVPDGIPLLSAKDIKNGALEIPFYCRKITLDDYKQIHTTYEIAKDDLLLTIVGTIGRVAIVTNTFNKFTFQRSVAIIRLNRHQVLPIYAFHYFQSERFQRVLIRKESASAQGGVYLGELGKTKIYFPKELKEQSNIAQILTNCDKVIEQTEAAITKYKAIKQGMLHDLFTRGLDENGKLRPAPSEAPDLYKESKLGLIPKGWEVKRLSEVASMKSGEGITSELISIIGNYPVYGGNGLRGFTTTYTHEGDYVLIGRQGALCGNTVRVSGKFYASEHAVVVTPFDNINADWLFQKLKDMNLNQYSEASAQPGLAVTKILRLFITTSKNEEQKIISKKLLSIDNKLISEEKVLKKNISIKQGLMRRLLHYE